MGRKRCRTAGVTLPESDLPPRKKSTIIDSPRRARILADIESLQGQVSQQEIFRRHGVSQRSGQRIVASNDARACNGRSNPRKRLLSGQDLAAIETFENASSHDGTPGHFRAAQHLGITQASKRTVQRRMAEYRHSSSAPSISRPKPSRPTTTATRQDLLQAAQAFCDAFAQQKPPKEILAHFSKSKDVRALEHGLQQLAPFLGRDFRGRSGLRQYFDLLSSNLTYDNMQFSNFVVDTEISKVSVRGEARFTWTSTDQSWDEVFTYVLEFDAHLKVKVYEIWADSGAAYLASKGLLNQ